MNTEQPLPSQELKLPTLVRSTALMSPESHAREIKDAAGKLGENDPAILGALINQRVLTESVAALEKIRQNRNPADTAANHMKKSADAYKKILASACAKHDSTRASINTRLAEIERKVEESLGLHVSSDASDIRSALRSMSREDRAAAVEAAIQEKDGAVLAVVLNGRELTTGITSVQRNSFRRRAEQAYAPELLQLRMGLERASKLVSDALDNIAEMEGQITGPVHVQGELTRQIEAADSAWLAFNQSVQ